MAHRRAAGPRQGQQAHGRQAIVSTAARFPAGRRIMAHRSGGTPPRWPVSGLMDQPVRPSREPEVPSGRGHKRECWRQHSVHLPLRGQRRLGWPRGGSPSCFPFTPGPNDVEPRHQTGVMLAPGGWRQADAGAGRIRSRVRPAGRPRRSAAGPSPAPARPAALRSPGLRARPHPGRLHRRWSAHASGAARLFPEWCRPCG